MIPRRLILAAILVTFLFQKSPAQLVITNDAVAQNLAQKLVGNGVAISNVSFQGDSFMAGYFINLGGTNIALDSGIVLTTGRAKTFNASNGLAGQPALLASNSWGLPGDPDLSAATGISILRDACILEFDFVPLGDSIKFNYVFSSEEYIPQYVCNFNDAFAFFISGPGITGLKNIALVPGTNTPVSIFNVNNVLNPQRVPICPNNPVYYIDNNSRYFTHQGLTVQLTASERVQACQTYHLKLVIADATDYAFDSGVFLGAKSLSSNAISFDNQVPIHPGTGINYLAEGCSGGSFSINRPHRDPLPMNVNLTYGGTALNGMDVSSLPASIIIPANDSTVNIPVRALTDIINEGIEELKIYAFSGCGNGIPSDSIRIEIREFERLPIVPPAPVICRNASIQLNAASGFTNYQWSWSSNSTVNNSTIPDPRVTPQNPTTVFTCYAVQNTCRALDSVQVRWKSVLLTSKTDLVCRNGNNGQIKISSGPGWLSPVSFSLDGINWQTDSTFNNLPAGNYWIKVRDGNCIDSLLVSIIQSFPDLLITNLVINNASCSGNADGRIQFSGNGGNGIYTYCLNGGAFQSNNSFNVTAGNHSISIRDGNGCITTQQVTIPTDNPLQVDAGTNSIICEGENRQIIGQSSTTNFSWFPTINLNNPSVLNPLASPVITTWYYLTARDGICTKTDSVLITVRPAPVANAGPDLNLCAGKVFQLQGSGGLSFQWSPSTNFISPTTVQTPDVKATSTISYFLSVTDGFNCASLSKDTIKVRVVPTVKLFAGNDTTGSINQPIQLVVIDRNNARVTNYSWTPSALLSDATISNPVARLQTDQRFVVKGTTPEGCWGIDDITIKVYKGPDIYVPTGFTPNKDGRNDVLKPVGAGIKEFQYFKVFNRYGQLVYSSSGFGTGWDGNLKGISQPSGVYIWMVRATDYLGNQIFRKGVVTIIR